jgi:regulator of sigma E protease
MELLAFEAGELLGHWVLPILGFLIGLGLVVFVHELGHFLVAKLVGIKVERFAIGMGPRLTGFTKGETEYCINILPIGGYVKMTGQDDFAPNPDQAPTDGDDKPQEITPATDPRAFQNKSVGARFAVISAGVIMNLIFAALLFVIIGMIGKKYPAPVIGDVVAGSPASSAQITWDEPVDSQKTTVGLTGGDRITRIEGDSLWMKLVDNNVYSFSKLSMVALLANDGDVYTMSVEREVDGKLRHGKALVGVTSTESNIGTMRKGFGIFSAMKPVIGQLDGMQLDIAPFKTGQRITKVGQTTIGNWWDVDAFRKELTHLPVEVTVADAEGKLSVHSVKPSLTPAADRTVLYLADGRAVEALRVKPKDDIVTVTDKQGAEHEFPAQDVVRRSDEQLDLLGLSPRVRAVTVVDGSPARKAGIRPGDIILQYGEVQNPSPRRLVELTKSTGGQEISISVLRNGETLSMTVVPRVKDGRAQIGIGPGGDLEHLVPADIRPGSPAAAAGILPGWTIKSVNDTPVETWADLYVALAQNAGKKVRIESSMEGVTRSADVELTPEAFDPKLYTFSLFDNFAFEMLDQTIVLRNPIKAVHWGIGQTWEFLITNYASLKQLISGEVGAKEVTGPLGIGSYAVMAGRKGPLELAHFMAFISVALAVMNFLPIPVVDGGHAVFLLIEKLRGRPLAAKTVWAVQVAGLVLLGLLLVMATWNDIVKLVTGTL